MNYFTFLRCTLIVLVVGLVLCCQRVHAQQYTLRTVDLISDLPGIDFYLNNRVPATFGNVPFEWAEAVVKLPVEQPLNIKVTEQGVGIGTTLIDQAVTVEMNMAYIALAYGTKAAPKFKLLARPLGMLPQPGKSLVRIVHAASIATGFDFYIDSLSDPFFSAIAQDSATPFKSVDKKIVKLFITTIGSKLPIAAVLAPLIPSSPDLGAHLTLIITGTSQSNLKVYILHGENEDRYQLTALEQAGTMLPSVRAVNALPTKTYPSMDIYLEKALKTKKVVYRGTSESYQGLTEDSTTVQFVPTDEGPANALLSRGIKLNNDTGYTTILTQHKDGGLTSLQVPTFLGEPNAGPPKVRFANVSDFFGNLSIVLRMGTDTIHFDDVPFLTYTPWRQITSGNVYLEAYRPGGTTPFYTGNYIASDSKLLTLIALGEDTSTAFTQFAVDVLDESVASTQPRMQSFSGPVESVDEEAIAARSLELTNLPNPFSNDTRVSFTLAKGAHVRVEFFDALGRRVAPGLDESLEAGRHQFTLHAHGLAPGMYTCVLQAGTLRTTRQMIVVR